VCGWQVKLCDPLVTHGPYLEIKGLMYKGLYKFIYLNFTSVTDVSCSTDCLNTDSQIKRVVYSEIGRRQQFA